VDPPEILFKIENCPKDLTNLAVVMRRRRYLSKLGIAKMVAVIPCPQMDDKNYNGTPSPQLLALMPVTITAENMSGWQNFHAIPEMRYKYTGRGAASLFSHTFVSGKRKRFWIDGKEDYAYGRKPPSEICDLILARLYQSHAGRPLGFSGYKILATSNIFKITKTSSGSYGTLTLRI
jgi:hypothetical protein